MGVRDEQSERVRYPVQNEKNFIFPSIRVLFCLLYQKIVLLPHKNRAVYSNAFHDIISGEKNQ